MSSLDVSNVLMLRSIYYPNTCGLIDPLLMSLLLLFRAIENFAAGRSGFEFPMFTPTLFFFFLLPP